MRLFACVVLNVMMIACDSSSDTNDSSDGVDVPSSGVSSERVEAMIAHQRAWCAHHERCSSEEYGRMYSSQQACETETAWRGRALAELLFAQQSGLHKPSTSELVACTRALRQTDNCTSPEACNFQAEPAPLLGEHALCRGDLNVESGKCEPGLTCQREVIADCGFCVPLVAAQEGDACETSSACGEGLYCDENAVCQQVPPPGALGEPCPRFACLPGFDCAGPSDARTCQQRLSEGRSCGASSDPPCYFDLECGPSLTCERRLPNDAPCTHNGSPSCLNFCVFDSPDAEAGTCSDVGRLPQAGEPCVYAFGSPYCAGDSYADQTSVDDERSICVCAPLGVAGESCDGHHACRGGICSQGRCNEQPRANGEECPSRLDQQCESGNCDTSSDPPVCVQPCVALAPDAGTGAKR